MIISTSVDNLTMDLESLFLANQYGEKRSVFGRSCMDEFDADARLTFISHAEAALAPKQFVTDFISFCPDNTLPASLQIIDFVWSRAGQDSEVHFDHEKIARFAKEVAAILIEENPELRVNVLTQVLKKPIFNEKDIRRILDFNENFQFTAEALADLPRLSQERREALILLNNRIAELKQELFESMLRFEVTRMINHLFTGRFPASQADLRYQIDAYSRLAYALRNPDMNKKEVNKLLNEILQDPKLDNPKNRELKIKIQEILPYNTLSPTVGG